MKYTILSIIILSLYSCVSNSPEQQTLQHTAIPKINDTLADNHTEVKEKINDTLSYNYKEVKEISSYLTGTEDNLDTTYYRITYPVFVSEHFNKLVRSAIFIEGDDDPQEAAQAFVDGYNEFVEEETTQYVSAPWVKDIQSRIHLNTPQLLTLCTRFYEYTGGAHGHTVAIWSNFDLLEMRKIQLTDIVAEDKLPELTQISEKHFRTIENLADSTSLAKDFFFMNGIFALNDNFGLTETELIFYYNEYEIKPYAKGSTMIKIPYTEITDIISTRGQQYINSIRK